MADLASHSSKSQPSVAFLKFLKQSEEEHEESRRPFTLEVTEEAPTSTQMQNILDIIGEQKIGEVVPGAIGKADAIKLADKSPDQVKRPIVVDWGNAKVILASNKSELQKLIDQLS